MTDEQPIRVQAVDVLYKDRKVLKKARFDFRRRNGEWQTLDRLVFEIGDASTVLPYDAARGTVLLIRQFRLPAYMAGKGGFLIEACAGKLDSDDPETCARREAEEELGYRLASVERVFEAFMSPASVSERMTFFLAPYTPSDKITAGGGLADEGEDIEVIETPFAAAWALIERGEIIDAKTIILLQQLKLSGHMPA
jgi:nudix-type nucleoside diphosphatase (YffH/AdpP family)